MLYCSVGHRLVQQLYLDLLTGFQCNSPGGISMAMSVRMNAETTCKPYSPPKVDRIWLWVYYNKIPIYPIFYLLN